MSLNLHLPENPALKPRITVFGVGGAGGNAVSNMIASNLEGVNFVVANTDAQSLENAKTDKRIQLGETITRGLGAGSSPDVGRASAEEALEEILGHLQDTHMAFVTAGMGGGTGTGAAPVIARIAREQGILTVGVVTKPFHFEGSHRMKIAELGIEEMQKYVDTLIVIPNQNLFRIANENTTFADAFRMADNVLHSGVRGITDLMIMPGLINLDFADVRAVMGEMGKAMMGTGEAEGERRATQAAEAAISNPLLDNVSMQGARGVLINITGGADMTLFEVDEAANRIRDEVDPEANIIFGSAFNSDLDGTIRVSVVATGIDGNIPQQQEFVGFSNVQSTSQAGASFAPVDQPVAEEDIPEPTPANDIEEAAAEPTATEPAEEPAEAKAKEYAFVPPQAAEPNQAQPAIQEPATQPATPATEEAPSQPEEEPQRGGFGIFGKVVANAARGNRPAEEPKEESSSEDDFFADEDAGSESKSQNELLDIPAFLRRQP